MLMNLDDTSVLSDPAAGVLLVIWGGGCACNIDCTSDFPGGVAAALIKEESNKLWEKGYGFIS